MAVDGALGDEEAAAVLLVAQAVGHEARTFDFALREQAALSPSPAVAGASSASPSARCTALSRLKLLPALNSASNLCLPRTATADSSACVTSGLMTGITVAPAPMRIVSDAPSSRAAVFARPSVVAWKARAASR